MAFPSMFVTIVYSTFPFLAQSGPLPAGMNNVDDWSSSQVFDTLNSEASSLGKARKIQIEASLRPIFEAMPKDSKQGLRIEAASDALGRVLSLRNSWSTARAAAAVESLLEAKHHRGTFKAYNFDELAEAASALEQHVEAQALQNLDAAFAVHRLNASNNVTLKDAAEVVDTYVAARVSGARLASLTEDEAMQQQRAIGSSYRLWNRTRHISEQCVEEESAGASFINSEQMARAARESDRRHANLHNEACRDLKTTLLRHELHGSGRIRLSHFYEANFSTRSWHVDESPEHLRSVGALDESTPDRQLVIVANYLTSESNCVGGRNLNAKCCANECDMLFGRLEQDLGIAAAYPFELIPLVKALGTSTVTAPRELPEKLIERLHMIAARNDGSIPLHGRMFAQWMHHAFPRECPLPPSFNRDVQTSRRLRSDGGREQDQLRYKSVSVIGFDIVITEVMRTIMLFLALISVLIGLFRLVRESGIFDELKGFARPI